MESGQTLVGLGVKILVDRTILATALEVKCVDAVELALESNWLVAKLLAEVVDVYGEDVKLSVSLLGDNSLTGDWEL